jgi:hypothetical protein
MMKQEDIDDGKNWLQWHYRQTRNHYDELLGAESEQYLLLKNPSPPMLLDQYIDDLESEHYIVKDFLSCVERYAKMATGITTDKEKEDSLSELLSNFTSLIDQYPWLSPDYDGEL